MFPANLLKLDGRKLTLINLDTNEELMGRLGFVYKKDFCFFGIAPDQGPSIYFPLPEFSYTLGYQDTVVFVSKNLSKSEHEVRIHEFKVKHAR